MRIVRFSRIVIQKKLKKKKNLRRQFTILARIIVTVTGYKSRHVDHIPSVSWTTEKPNKQAYHCLSSKRNIKKKKRQFSSNL